MRGFDQILNHVLLDEKRTVPQAKFVHTVVYFVLDSLPGMRYKFGSAKTSNQQSAISNQQSAKKIKTKAQLEAD